MNKYFILLIIFIVISVTSMDAQRRSSATYESLLQRSDQPSAYIDDAVIPISDSTAVFAAFFRLDYDFIPFLRKRPNIIPPSEELNYFAPVRMGMEIFEGKASDSRRANRNRISLFRDSYQDTVWVEQFEQTKSRLDHAQGFIGTQLSAGDYHYELQLTRGESVREIPSRNRNITIPRYSRWDKAAFTLLKNSERNGNTLRATLLNYGSSVLYGQDYEVLVAIPDTGTDISTYTFSLYRMQAGSDTSTEGDPVFETKLSDGILFHGRNPVFEKQGESVVLNMDTGSGNIRFAHIPVPNRDYENARYKLVLTTGNRDAETDKPLGERVVNSQWLDMPISLYNIDVAISMMKFIVDESEIRRLNSGSASEKENKFRKFWDQRDPTPETEFNELMAEYFNRIDHAYENFTSLQVPGYETDRGRAYILYGPPVKTERQFPTGKPTREIWEYPGRTLIFEADSGFRNFRLVSEN